MLRAAPLVLALVATGGIASLDAPFVCAEPAPCLADEMEAPPGTQGVRVVIHSGTPGAFWVENGDAPIVMMPGNAMAPGLNAWVFLATSAPPSQTWTFHAAPMSGSQGTVRLVSLEWLPEGCAIVRPPYEEGVQNVDAVAIAAEHWEKEGSPAPDGPATVDRRHRDIEWQPTVAVACPGMAEEAVRDVWSVEWEDRVTLVDAASGEVLRAWLRSG